MNDDSCLDCSDIPCNYCGFPRGDCHCTPEQVESAHYSLQQVECKIVPCICRVIGPVVGDDVTVKKRADCPVHGTTSHVG